MLKILIFSISIFLIGLIYYFGGSYYRYQRLLQVGLATDPSNLVLDLETEIAYPDPPTLLVSTLQSLGRKIIDHCSVAGFTETNLKHEIQVISYPRRNSLPIQRAVMTVPCLSTQQLYEFLTSIDGYAMIDPVRNQNLCTLG